jgi:hypothetical protein
LGESPSLANKRISRFAFSTALCAETHEAWLEDNRYIDMDLLREERKEHEAATRRPKR